MARCPFARWRPLPENTTQPAIDPDQIILHSAVDAQGETSLYPFFGRADVKVESTFFIQFDGDIEQYMDTEVRADANLESNWRAISIETEDDGNPNQNPWSPAQLESIHRLLDWCFATHPKIARRVCPTAYEPGVGYHSMWGTGPTPWIPYSSRGKTCPGTIRIAQFEAVIVPWLTRPEPDDLPGEDMNFTYNTPGKPTFFCHAGKSVGLNERTDLENMRNAHTALGAQPLVHYQLDDDTFAKFRERFPGA